MNKFSTPVETALTSLWAAGYRANASNLFSGYVAVQDPVKILTPGGSSRLEHVLVQLHHSQVPKFITDRS